MGSSDSDSDDRTGRSRDAASDARALAEALAPCFASLADACLRAHEAVCAIADVAPTTTLTRKRGTGADGKKLTKKQKRELRAPRQPTAFNLFMKAEVVRVRAEKPGLGPKEVFTECAARWKAKKAAMGGAGGSLAGASTSVPVKEKKARKEKSHKKDKKHRDQ